VLDLACRSLAEDVIDTEDTQVRHSSPPHSVAVANDHTALLMRIGVLAASSLVIFYCLGERVIRTWDESIYAEVAREMVARHNWLTPHWNFQPWFEKPPLFMWITAFLYQLFGISELSTRIFGAVCAVATIWITFELGRKLMDEWHGLLAATILLTNVYFIFTARYGAMDVPLTLCLLVVGYGYSRVREGERRWWYIIGLVSGVALMLKGAAGLLAPLSVGMALLLDHRSSDLRSREFRYSVLLALGVALPWHLTMLFIHGRAFLVEYIGYHVVARIKGFQNHLGPVYFTALTYWLTFLPFAVVAFIGLVLRFRRPGKFAIVISSVIIVTLCFTVVGTKLMTYSVPAYPFISLLAASAIQTLKRMHRYAALVIVLFLFSIHFVLTSRSEALKPLVGISYGSELGWVGSINSKEEPLMHLLSAARSNEASERPQPLIIDLEGYTIQKQQSVFYARRPVLQTFLGSRPGGVVDARYEDLVSLDAAVTATPRLIITRRETYQELTATAQYTFAPIAEDGPLVLALICKRRNSP
jgi:hypothetical protein